MTSMLLRDEPMVFGRLRAALILVAVVAATGPARCGAAPAGAAAAAPAPLRFTPPKPGQKVLEPRAGATPLIGLPADLFDPAASAQECCDCLARDGVPRQRRLTPAEREVETGFAEWVQTRVPDAVDAALRLAEAAGSADQPVFEVDGMKRLVPEYGAGGKAANPAEFRFRLAHNHALHPAAVALARLAFLRRLDVLGKLPEGHELKQVFVTNGGCAAGKGSLTKIVKDALGDKATFGAVWDAAGEGDALENAWILEAAGRRGVRVVYGYAEADPATRYQGVLERGADTGRVVDVMTFINSYCDGAAAFRGFLGSPAYERAVAAGRAAAFGINPGEFDLASLQDKSKPAFPNLRNLAPRGSLKAADLADPPDRLRSLEAALGILERFVKDARGKGEDPDPVARAAISNAIKFLDIQPAEVRQAVLASHARIFGGNEP
jgi:hypothetical protein